MRYQWLESFWKNIWRYISEELELNALFLNLDIEIIDSIFVYKLFDKRDAFPFSIVRMPHIDSNIPESIFYSALVGEFLRIARSTLLLKDFLEKARVMSENAYTGWELR